MREKLLNEARAAELWAGVKDYVSKHGAPGAGAPVGTVISFLGTAAPAGYLACDGAEYGVSEYPALAAFFRQQFGAANHFGGDGAETFAVPDLRNLFLRGYRGEAEEQLSGEIGQRQEATVHPSVYYNFTYSNGTIVGFVPDGGFIAPEHRDEVSGAPGYSRWMNVPNTDRGTTEAQSYTSRPVNMAVLYCIKAVADQGTPQVQTGGSVPVGTIVIWSGAAEEIPEGWALCDGEDGRPDLRGKFVLGAEAENAPEAE